MSDIEVEVVRMEQVVQVQPGSDELVRLLLIGNLRSCLLSGEQETLHRIAADWSEWWWDRCLRSLSLALSLCTLPCVRAPLLLREAGLIILHGFHSSYFC